MIRFSKLFFGFTVFVLLLWLLPWAYNFAFYKPERTPFTLWSCVVGDFAVVDFAGDGIVRRDRGGRTYTDREFDSILPTFYARQLLNDESTRINTPATRIWSTSFCFGVRPAFSFFLILA